MAVVNGCPTAEESLKSSNGNLEVTQGLKLTNIPTATTSEQIAALANGAVYNNGNGTLKVKVSSGS